MNNENNNLNGVVLGNIQAEPTVNNETNSVVEPQVTEPVQSVNPNVVVQPTVNPNPQPMEPINPVVEPTIVEPAPTVNQNVVEQPSVGPVEMNNQVMSPQNVEVPVNNNTPNVETSQPAQPSVNVNEVPKEYTSLNNINPTLPNVNNIGTNPPISLEPTKEPKRKKNKTLFVIIIIILLAGIAVGTYWILNYTDLLVKKDSITISTKDLSINMGDTLSNDISDYAEIKGTSSNNCSLNLNNIDTTKEGEYKYSITCSKTTKEGKVIVVDNSIMNVSTKTVYAAKDSTLEAKNFIENPVDSLTYSFENEDEVNSIINGDVGSYTIKIKVVSEGGKESTISAKLVILENKIKGYSICTSSEQQITDATMKESIKLAIADDGGENKYGNVAIAIYTFKYSSELEYAKLVSEYQEKGSITINDIKGTTKFDDSSLTITIENELDNSEVFAKYGESNIKDYVTMRAYFKDKLGYTCSYEKAND